MLPGRVLITGATGFVGRALTADLLRRGVPVTVATRRPDTVPPAGSRAVAVGEIGSRTDWTEALAGAVSVVHLAARVHVAPELAAREAVSFDETNRAGTARLFDQASRRGVGRFVFVSSVAVLGSGSPPGRPFDDDSVPHPETVYARSKREAEVELIELARSTRMELVILRPPLICGPGVKGNLAALIRLARLPVPLPFGSATNRRTLLALDNLVSAIGAVLEADGVVSGRVYGLGDRMPLSTGEIVTALRAGLGRRPGLIRLPPELVRSAVAMLGRPGLYRRLFGDLELDAGRFRQDFRWTDLVTTEAALRRSAEEN